MATQNNSTPSQTPTAASDYQKAALAGVRAAYKKGHLVLVAGAGVTISSLTSVNKIEAKRAAERLTWPGLLQYGLEYIRPRRERLTEPQRKVFDLYSTMLQENRDELDTETLIATADFVKKRLQDPTQNQFSTWLQLSFSRLYVDYIKGEDVKILAAIQRLHTGGARVMTTNYDDIIERYCKISSILPSQTPAMHEFFNGRADDEPPGILHVHGLWNDAKSTVLDAVDYRDTTSNSTLQSALRSLFESHAVLVFMGTGMGMDDPNFGELLNWAKRNFDSGHRHYVLLRNGDELEDVSVLSPLYYGQQYADLPRFLDSIADVDEIPEEPGSAASNRPPSFRALESLKPKYMGLRQRTIDRPAPGTCTWPSNPGVYQDWLKRRNIETHHGLLCLTGRPGSGKSVLVKELARTCAAQAQCLEDHVATFFFDARSPNTEQKSVEALLQALCYQLLPLCKESLKDFSALYATKIHWKSNDTYPVKWETRELQEILEKLCRKPRDDPVYLFIDAVDECEDSSGYDAATRSIVIFFRQLTSIAYRGGSNFNICMSSARDMTVSIRNYSSIALDDMRHGDVKKYVSQELAQWDIEPSHQVQLEAEIIAKAGNIFLWARLALGLVAEAVDDGIKIDPMLLLRTVPAGLEDFFDQMLRKLSLEERLVSLRLFQWALFVQRPLSAEEWSHVLTLIDTPDICSVYEGATHTLKQMARRVRKLTGGLLEVNHEKARDSIEGDLSPGTRAASPVSEGSNSAIAGSMVFPSQETPVVQFVHDFARQFFLDGKGFNLLGRKGPPESIADGHLYILTTCLRYLGLKEMDRLVPDDSPSDNNREISKLNHASSNVSIASLGSSAATSTRRSSDPRTNEALVRSKRRASDPEATKIAMGDDPIRPPTGAVNGNYVSDWIQDNFTADASNLAIDRNLLESRSTSSDEFPGAATLDNDPALRLYAIDMLEYHAIASDEADADPDDLLKLMGIPTMGVCWRRYCQLNGGTTWDTTPAYFAAERNLSTWIKWYARFPRRARAFSRAGGELRFPLLIAVSRRHSAIIEIMLPHIDIHARESDLTGSRTILHHLAACEGGESVLSVLCEGDSAEIIKSTLRTDMGSQPSSSPVRILRGRAFDRLLEGLDCIGSPSLGGGHYRPAENFGTRMAVFFERKGQNSQLRPGDLSAERILDLPTNERAVFWREVEEYDPAFAFLTTHGFMIEQDAIILLQEVLHILSARRRSAARRQSVQIDAMLLNRTRTKREWPSSYTVEVPWHDPIRDIDQ